MASRRDVRGSRDVFDGIKVDGIVATQGGKDGIPKLGCPMNPLSPAFIEMLRSELARLEATPGVDPGDPSFFRFKASIQLTLAELELREAEAA